MAKELTQERLKELYYLNDDGKFIGKRRGTRNYGRVAGNKDKGIYIDGKQYIFSRLKALYITGKLPEMTRGGHRPNSKDYSLERSILTTKWV